MNKQPTKGQKKLIGEKPYKISIEKFEIDWDKSIEELIECLKIMNPGWEPKL